MQQWVEAWIKTIGLGIGAMMAFLVPFWGWRKEAKSYQTQKQAAASSAGASALHGVGGAAAMQAIVIDGSVADKIVAALDRHTAALKGVCDEMGGLKRAGQDVEHQLERLKDALDDRERRGL